ncbi:DNA cytosine methyltransferase [Bifidobacterium animalis]|uniref:DNA cytosine methyltransferase n=1 Tax=Bifidobacterium animalis TaxID=28025 RepID=UPI001F4CB978|nr:DNA cytosine methyltransferase [Bifidobacterium animalis]
MKGISRMTAFTSIEICAGAGGQALGLEKAGFKHLALVEIEKAACETLKHNRPQWNVIEGDLHSWDAEEYKGQVDLFAGGVPCPPFSKAGKQLGALDERNLFPRALELISECKPRAVMFENVRGLLDPAFDSYREWIDSKLREMGYEPQWKLLQASDFGVPQLRPRVICVALPPEAAAKFQWPKPSNNTPSVGEALYDLMASKGWPGAKEWAEKANTIAPTLVGGSKKHGGPDLGPTRSKRAWLSLGVDGGGVANDVPNAETPADFIPKLTVRMTARIQGFPDSWEITGRKTSAYRQVGNAFPPPVAEAVGRQIRKALEETQ